MTSDDLQPILDENGNRIGIMTVGGPIFSLSKVEEEQIRQAAVLHEDAKKAKLLAVSKAAREGRMAQILEPGQVEAHKVVRRLTELTFYELHLVEQALQNHDSVNLPYAVNQLLRLRTIRDRGKHAIEVGLSAAARRLYNRGLGTVKKREDGLIWVTVSRERIATLVMAEAAAKRQEDADNINLMRASCESQTFPAGSPRKAKKVLPTSLPSRASSERLEACRLLKGIKMLDNRDRIEINHRFTTYNNDVSEKIITLINGKTNETVGYEYSTRFNDLGKAIRNLDRFDAALENSFALDTRQAVFLTLTTDPNLHDDEREATRQRKIADCTRKLNDATISEYRRAIAQKQLYTAQGPDYEIADLKKVLETCTSKQQAAQIRLRLSKLEADKEIAPRLVAQLNDPKTGIRTRESLTQSLKRMNRWQYKYDPDGFQNLWDADRSFGKAWNGMMSYFKKKLGKRPKYLSSFEFTDSGLLHIHVLVFVERLLDEKEISLEWRRLGQGEIAYIYSLSAKKKRDGSNGFEWRWNKKKPHDSKGKSGGDYLKKYVRKCMFALTDKWKSPADIQSMYWVINKKMWSCSNALQPADDKKPRSATPTFSFFHVFTADQADMWVDRMAYTRMRPEWSTAGADDADSGGAV